MKITRNLNGAIKANGKSIDMYLFTGFLIANHLGPPSQATPQIIERFLNGETMPDNDPPIVITYYEEELEELAQMEEEERTNGE